MCNSSCVPAHTFAGVCSHMYKGQKATLGVCLSVSFHLILLIVYLETGSPSEHVAHGCRYTVWPASSRNLLVSTGVLVCSATPKILHSFWELSSGPPVCMTNALLIESSSSSILSWTDSIQPQSIWKSRLFISRPGSCLPDKESVTSIFEMVFR